MIASTTIFQKPQIFVGDFVKILKKEEVDVWKGIQSFIDKIFEFLSILTLNPPTYFLIGTDREIIQGEIYHPERQLVQESPLKNRR